MKTFVLMLTLALLAIPSTAVNAGKERADDVSFSGTWKTIAGGTHQYIVILKQVGKNVTGSYSPGNGKVFDGVVTDNKLAFKWTQDGGFEGTAEFTMDEDGKGFTGNSTALKPKEFTVTWNTYIPPVTSFAGTWETITNGQHHFVLTMVQTGTKVTGVYPRANGAMEGTVSGRVLRFTWKSDGGSGSGRLVMDETEKAFSGTYNKGDNPDDVENTWNGKLPAAAGDKAPEKVTPPEKFTPPEKVTPPDEVTPRDEVTPPMASFAGAWQGKLGESFLELILQQSGDRVTGQFNVNSNHDWFFKDGIVVGNTLRFTIERRNRMALPNRYLPDEYVGTGELVIDRGGKSFTGIVLGAATSGTLVGR